MSTNLSKLLFSDVQNILDALLGQSKYAQENAPVSANPPQPHLVFWRQTGDYDKDYTLFTTGDVPNVGIPIMNTTPSQELTSNFYVIITNTDGLQGMPQMPVQGPYLTDKGFQLKLNGSLVSGSDIIAALKSWLTNGFPK